MIPVAALSAMATVNSVQRSPRRPSPRNERTERLKTSTRKKLAEQAYRLRPQQKKFATLRETFRSGLEEKIAQQISNAGATFAFEKFYLPWTAPEKPHKYTPDFLLQNGIIVETKGLFQTSDRQKMKRIREMYPDLDIRFVFSNAQARIAKKSKTTYAMWAEANGFKWAHRDIPPAWLKEPAEVKRIAAAKLALKPKGK